MLYLFWFLIIGIYHDLWIGGFIFLFYFFIFSGVLKINYFPFLFSQRTVLSFLIVFLWFHRYNCIWCEAILQLPFFFCSALNSIDPVWFSLLFVNLHRATTDVRRNCLLQKRTLQPCMDQRSWYLDLLYSNCCVYSMRFYKFRAFFMLGIED